MSTGAIHLKHEEMPKSGRITSMASYAWLLLACLAVAMLIGYFLYGNPDADFRSSDGKWADGEDSFNGRHFEDVVVYFEAYKLNCSASKAILLRTTPQDWNNFFAWRRYKTDRKWRVPFGKEIPEIGNYYPPVNLPNCANQGWSDRVSNVANSNAKRYLNHL
jgi:hypothetical protein